MPSNGLLVHLRRSLRLNSGANYARLDGLPSVKAKPLMRLSLLASRSSLSHSVGHASPRSPASLHARFRRLSPLAQGDTFSLPQSHSHIGAHHMGNVRTSNKDIAEKLDTLIAVLT